ncbi:MAG: prepilin-type N-terminal cleavage/methylation domain-containing protein [Verrucomicrobia bacterium]|nr:prepilin-type N-terminal cleavage/methylation domain-containing protein [Verrucomicrobiota bacterium]
MKRRPAGDEDSGFTLIEIILAVGIGVIFMGGAAVFLSSTGGDKDLADSRNIVEEASRGAREQALKYGRQQRVILGTRGVGGTMFPEGVEMNLITPEDMALGRRGWAKPEDYQWLFTGGGLVEPIRVRLKHGDNMEQFSVGALTGETTTEKPDR